MGLLAEDYFLRTHFKVMIWDLTTFIYDILVKFCQEYNIFFLQFLNYLYKLKPFSRKFHLWDM